MQRCRVKINISVRVPSLSNNSGNARKSKLDKLLLTLLEFNEETLTRILLILRNIERQKVKGSYHQ